MADGKSDKKKKPANRINELLEKPVKLVNTASPDSKPEMDAPGAVFTLELNYEGRDLKLSVHESRLMEIFDDHPAPPVVPASLFYRHQNHRHTIRVNGSGKRSVCSGLRLTWDRFIQRWGS